MDLPNKDLPLKFYNYLCDVIGSEEVVNTRRAIFASQDIVGRNPGGDDIIIIGSGSKSEGLYFEDSDFDVMCVLPASVYESYEDITGNILPDEFAMIMDSSDTKPGFTKLKPHDQEFEMCFSERIDDVLYLSSKLWREHFFSEGPCASSIDSTEDIESSIDSTEDIESSIDSTEDIESSIDSTEYIKFMYCLRCSKWLLQARPWIARLQYSWATDETLKQIINFGVSFVPVGSKKSPNEDIEWRISFSYAEKLLVWSFNHVQFLCYALLKIVLKDEIKKKHGDVLCSYFLKTIMFWICEETEEVQWRPEEIFSCFKSCIKRLLYCVENKICPNYFIPENNYFENRFDIEEHKSLLSTLRRLFRSGYLCLMNTKTLRSFPRWLQPSLSSKVLSVSYLSSFNDIQFDIHKPFVYNHPLEKLIHPIILRKGAKDVYIYFLSVVCQRYANSDLCKVSSEYTNKEQYKYYRKGLCYSLLGTNHDAVSGWLVSASFFYTNKQYRNCEKLLKHCFSKHIGKKCEVSSDMDLKKEHRFNMIQRTRCLKMLTACKTLTVAAVPLNEQSSILPNDLKRHIDFIRGECLDFPPLEFAKLLKYFLQIQKHNQRVEKLVSTVTTLEEQLKLCSNRSNAFD